MDRISAKYSFILKRSWLGLLPVIFGLFVAESWPLIYVRISLELRLFQREKRCSGTIVRFSDNSSYLSKCVNQ